MLPPEQITKIKEQLIQQIEANFPDDKKQSAKQQIQDMNTEQLERFLIQNNLIKDSSASGRASDFARELPKGRVGGEPVSSSSQQCIFCSIVSGDVQSYKIDENKDSIAILEINPISKAHTLIIPKQHISSSEKFPRQFSLLQKKLQKK